MTRVFFILLSLLFALKAEAHVSVDLKSIEFRPGKIKAKEREEITFTNRDPFKHDVYIVDA
ncbi:MAG: hypothetical protein ACE5JU_13960, partial [Candidatus Binatia bacterium]